MPYRAPGAIPDRYDPYEGGGYLIVKNSWGTDFGDGGYVYILYSYVRPRLMTDIWTAIL